MIVLISYLEKKSNWKCLIPTHAVCVFTLLEANQAPVLKQNQPQIEKRKSVHTAAADQCKIRVREVEQM